MGYSAAPTPVGLAQHGQLWLSRPIPSTTSHPIPSHPTPSHPSTPLQYVCHGPSSPATSHHASLLLQVFYNNKGYHSMPTYLNALNNAILRANLPKSKGNPAAYGEDLEALEGRSTLGTALRHGPARL